MACACTSWEVHIRERVSVSLDLGKVCVCGGGGRAGGVSSINGVTGLLKIG